MADFDYFGGIDFSGAREPLANLWSVLGREVEGRLRIVDVRPHAFRADLGSFVATGWRGSVEPAPVAQTARILWGADFPFALPAGIAARLAAPRSWTELAAWVADRPAEEIRDLVGADFRTPRATDSQGALAPLDLRLYKQTVEGIRWLAELSEEHALCIHPLHIVPDDRVSIIEVHPSATARELGLPRRRLPSRPGEIRARGAALRTFLDFTNPASEAIAVTLEDAWDATLACLTAYLCRSDLDQPFRTAQVDPEQLRSEGWIYKPPAALA